MTLVSDENFMRISQPTFRVLICLGLPILISAIISTLLLTSHLNRELNQQSRQFGQATVDQLALAVANHLVNEDLLSLNLLARESINGRHFDFVSIYNLDNKLLAQAGKSHSGKLTFNRQITAQNVVLGHVEISFDISQIHTKVSRLALISVGLHAALMLICFAFVIMYGDLLYLWVMDSGRSKLIPDKSDSLDKTGESQAELHETTILVVKLRPARLLKTYQTIINQALALHSGKVQQSGDDLIVYFKQADQLLQAMRAARILIYLIELLPNNLSIKLGLHHCLNDDELNMARKQTSYLASNSDNQILTSKLIHSRFGHSDQFTLTPYHSAMTPDGEVYQLEQISHQGLLESQAKELSRSFKF